MPRQMQDGGIDYNLLAGMGRSAAQSHTQGLSNALAVDQFSKDEETRNALAAYLESPEEERETRFNALTAADPKAAADVMTLQNARDDRATLGRQRHAIAALSELNAIKHSKNPATAFKLMIERPGENNALRGLADQLQSQGAINLEDGISDEEAAMISDIAITQLTPVAAMEDDERAAPAAIREMEALGYDLTPEGFAQYNADRGSEGGSLADTLAATSAQLAIDARRDEINRQRRADEEAERTRVRDRTQLRNTVRRSINQTADIAALTEKLEGSFLEAGMPASSWRRTGASLLAGAGAALRMDVEDLEKDLVNFDKLKKGLSDQLNNLVSSGSLGPVTNDKLQSFRDALANTETSPGAVMSIQAGIAEAMLEEADANEFEVFDRDKVEANIERWRHYDSPGAEATINAPAAAAKIADVGRMGVTELQALLADAANLSDEVLEAASARWDALNAAPAR